MTRDGRQEPVELAAATVPTIARSDGAGELGEVVGGADHRRHAPPPPHAIGIGGSRVLVLICPSIGSTIFALGLMPIVIVCTARRGRCVHEEPTHAMRKA